MQYLNLNKSGEPYLIHI